MNKLYYGDCLTIMNEWPDSCVDLIYLDPPFNSNRQYNAIYKDETGRPLPDQVEAFCDMWELDEERERAIRAMPLLMREAGIDDSIAEFWRLWMRALRDTQPRLLAYLSYMAERLLIMRRALKPTGSLYLHCDPTASHYIKALLDAIFGHQNFRNEIIWRRAMSKGNTSVRLPRNHDVILSYAASQRSRVMNSFIPYDLDDLPEKTKEQYSHIDEEGRRYQLTSLTNPNRNRPNLTYEFLGVTRVWRWTEERMQAAYDAGMIVQTRPGAVPRFKRYLDEQRGMPLDDIWTDIPAVSADEDMGYDTQKPRALLERIISMSSNEGDVVLDPFCGCATTIEAAHTLNRNWIGIDIAIHAIKRVARVRLDQRLGLVEGRHYEIEGVPRTVEGAQDLWERDKYHFQKWAVEQVEGFVTTRRTSDGGIDGRVYFALPDDPDLQSMVVEVKGGRGVNIRDPPRSQRRPGLRRRAHGRADSHEPPRPDPGTQLQAIHGRGRRDGHSRRPVPPDADTHSGPDTGRPPLQNPHSSRPPRTPTPNPRPAGLIQTRAFPQNPP